MKSTSLITSRKLAQSSSELSPGQSWKPRLAQRLAMKFLLSHGSAGLLLDPGLGKTSSCYGAIKILKAEGMIEKVLVVAPKRVMTEVWPVEAREWKDFHCLNVVVLHGKDRERNLASDADVYVINPDGLDWLFAQKDRPDFDVLVIDESSKFKHTTTNRFRLLRPELPKFKRRWILTGSPMPNGYLDLFGQMYILDLGKSLGAYITHYRVNYFFQTGYGGYTWKLQDGMEKKIQKAIKPYTLRLEDKDFIDMPVEVPVTHRIELPPAARKAYDEVEEELFSSLDNGENVEAKSAAAGMMKCAQIANGGVYHYVAYEDMKSKREWTNLHDEKTNAVVDLIEELQGSPAMVAFEFDHDRDRLLKALGKNTPVLNGETKDKAFSEICRAWNAGELPVVLVHPVTVSHGLNLQKGPGHHLILYSIMWDYEVYDQLVRRLRRSGSNHKKVFVHSIVARDTVDEAKLRALRDKARRQGDFMQALKTYRKGRR